jgi:hypothetical protein
MTMETKKCKSGFTAVRLHYSVDPGLWPDGRIATLRAAIPGWRWLKEYEIDFSARGGRKVYDCFDPIVHVDLPKIHLAECLRFKVIDHGRRNPTACLWWAESLKTDTVYFYREYYRPDATIAEHAQAIKELEEPNETRQTLIDPSTHRRLDNSTTTIADEYARYGLPTTPADNNFNNGLECVTMSLIATLARWSLRNKTVHPTLAARTISTDQLHELARTRAVYFHPSMTNTIREIQQLSWDDAGTGQPISEQVAPGDDHCADCLRYALMRRYLKTQNVHWHR